MNFALYVAVYEKCIFIFVQACYVHFLKQSVLNDVAIFRGCVIEYMWAVTAQEKYYCVTKHKYETVQPG
jgi:hypothetical protein